MQDLRQGLYDLARELEPYAQQYRAKRAALYLTIVDENGAEVRINKTGEMTHLPLPERRRPAGPVDRREIGERL